MQIGYYWLLSATRPDANTTQKCAEDYWLLSATSPDATEQILTDTLSHYLIAKISLTKNIEFLK
jgi:hypothetical protein